MTRTQYEEQFDLMMEQIKPELKNLSNYDLVVGVPFFPDENERITEIIESIDHVLEQWIGRRQLIVCAGHYQAEDTLELIRSLDIIHPHIEFLVPEPITGRGTNLRAIMEISKELDADLLLFSSRMSTVFEKGIEPGWLENLITPVQGDYDLVLGSLRRHLGVDSIAHMLAAPVLETFYGFRVGDPLGGIYSISHDLVEELAHESMFWGESIKGYGIDFWILTRAICWGKSICEINMGGELVQHCLDTRNQIFHDTALTIFEAVKRDIAIWMQDKLVLKVADILASSEVKKADVISHAFPELLQRFKTGYQNYNTMLGKYEWHDSLKKSLDMPEKQFKLDDRLWVSMFLDFMLTYNFDAEEIRTDILSAFSAFYNGRVASYVVEMEDFRDKLETIPPAEKESYMVYKMESIRHELTSTFWQLKPEFIRRWLQKSEQSKPPLVPLGYMEYVPGRPIVVPKKITGKDQRVIETDGIFKSLRKQYYNAFNDFLYSGLKLGEQASNEDMVQAVESYIDELEKTLDELLPGDIHSQEGLQQFVDALFKLVPRQKMFTVSEGILRELLVRFPPINLMIPMGYFKPSQLISEMGTRDAFTYANLIETRSYTDRDLEWMAENLKPDSFEWVEIKPIILSENLNMGILSRGKISFSNNVTARMVIRPLENGSGGKYPKTRYFTSIIRRLVVAEHYSQLFRNIVTRRKNIGSKVQNCLLGLLKGEDFSAHNIFENYHHRGLVTKIQYIAEKLTAEGNDNAARLLRLMADGYGLAQVLEDNTFLSCTSWSWASYSFKGGVKIPGTWTTSVESRWFNHDFLENLYRALGYNADDIMEIVFRLIQSGHSSNNLLDMLLPARPKDVTVVVQEPTDEPSKHLSRYEGNPILEPVKEHHWESKYVLNPGALRLEDKVYLFYRAVGDDDVSHIGLAVTDGYNVLKRLPEPIFSPETPEEKMGCEDPRLIRVDDRIYMLYTAYDGNIAQIAAASISVDDMKNERYRNWRRDGLAFKNVWDKDAILFPHKIDGKYVIYHRIEPSIWVTYMNDIKFPIKEKHAIIAGPRPGRMWDSLKIGAGAQPIKTRHGWLLIYHGVDYNYVYSLGVLLVDLDNPHKLIYRSPNPILEPEEEYEVGLSGAWVPNVVFTCGAVGAQDKEVFDDNDDILVYYGAADTSIGLATAKVAELIPEEFRSPYGQQVL